MWLIQLMQRKSNMKTILITLGIAGVLGISIWWGNSKNDITVDPNSGKEVVLVSAVRQYLQKFHYSPKELNDSTSAEIFSLYLERIDGAKRFLTQKEINKLEPWKYKLDDQFKKNKIDFFNLSDEIIEDAIARSHDIYKEVVEEEFDLTQVDTIQLNPEKIDFAKDEKELKEYWRKYIKADILSRVARELEKQKEEDYEGEVLTLDEIKEKAIEKIKDTFEKWWNNLIKTRRTDWFSMYLNSFTNVYDPHTGFFRPKDKEDFDMRLSNRLEGIGAQLSIDGNYTKIVKLIPGGPAWKQGDLKADDKILKVEQDGEPPVDVVGMHIDEVVSLIRGEKGTYVTLHVKHVDGSYEEIEIKRDVIIFEQGYVKSFILVDSSHFQKIGYIKLPSFYTDFSNRSARSSASDVKKELEKLKRNNVQGIILDLRNNGGGSLRDVIDMAGLFIEDGPIVQVKSRRGAPYVLEDTDSDVEYRGPLIVLVNHFSASASEIMSAAMQDYGRGVIVGTSSTFGKGTVQRFYSLDKGLQGFDELKPLGTVKITTQKYYRINGGSVQLRGITPDIILPGKYNLIKVGEKDYKYAMSWSEISPAEYSQDVYTYDLSFLEEQSKNRVSQNKKFQILHEEAEYIKKIKEKSLISLNLDDYIARKEKREAKNEYFKGIHDKILGLAVNNLPSVKEQIATDSVERARYNAVIKNIEKDLYISEALNIMNDILHPYTSKEN